MNDRDRAAGGVVLRAQSTVLVIRDRYGRWTFPKGHLEPGETDEQAALRETCEETGVTAAITHHLDTLTYTLASGQPKDVVFFAMRHVSGEPQPQAEEIADCAFVETAEARRRLQNGGYPGYVALLDKALKSSK